MKDDFSAYACSRKQETMVRQRIADWWNEMGLGQWILLCLIAFWILPIIILIWVQS